MIVRSITTISKNKVNIIIKDFVLRSKLCQLDKPLYNFSARRCIQISRSPLQNRRANQLRNQHTVVYAIGEGWTGALGTGRIDQSILGHNDDDQYSSLRDSQSSSLETTSKESVSTVPAILYDTSVTNQYCVKELLACSVGWGHTALIVEETTTRTDADTDISKEGDKIDETSLTVNVTTTNTELLLTGRPHEFASLLRLQRLPRIMRNFMTNQTYRTIRRANILETHEELKNNKTVSLNPIDMIGGALTYLSKLFGNPEKDPDWNTARDQSYLIVPTSIPLPFVATTTNSSSSLIQFTTDTLPTVTDPRAVITDDKPVDVTCNAGTTAVTTEKGYVYTFGLNGIGQCGTGDPCNNVWIPSRVTGLSREYSAAGYRATTLPQSYPIQQTCLGLQHGICLNVAGEMFTWGKGDRGQLGNDTIDTESHTAIPITKAVIMNDDYTKKIEYHGLQAISQIAAGMIHSAAYEVDTNSVYVWGKHILPEKTDETIATGTKTRTGLKKVFSRDKIASDARIPVRVNGLPSDQEVLQIACGSHHTSILLGDGSVWCIGVSTDTKRPLHHPICIVEAGMIDLSTLTQFTAHMDRTTIVFDGQVLQVHLWEDVEYRKDAIFTPIWVDELLLQFPTAHIREVHRSWLHTAIVADHK